MLARLTPEQYQSLADFIEAAMGRPGIPLFPLSDTDEWDEGEDDDDDEDDEGVGEK